MGVSISSVCHALPKLVDKVYTERRMLPWKIKVSPATPMSLNMEIYLSVTGWLVGWFDCWLVTWGFPVFYLYLWVLEQKWERDTECLNNF